MAKIQTKSDLENFIKKMPRAELSSKARPIYDKMLAAYTKIIDKHGRSNESREAVARANDLMGQLIIESKKPSQLAPKKKKTETKTKNPHKTKKIRKPKPRYANEPAISGKGLCLCGCGEEPNSTELKNGDVRYKLFVQGHDARLKGKIRAVAKGDLPRSIIPSHAKLFILHWRAISSDDAVACGIHER